MEIIEYEKEHELEGQICKVRPDDIEDDISRVMRIFKNLRRQQVKDLSPHYLVKLKKLEVRVDQLIMDYEETNQLLFTEDE